MKKFLALVLALVMVLALAACGGSGDSDTNNPSTNTPSTNEPSTNTPSTNEPSTNEPSTNEPSTNEPAAPAGTISLTVWGAEEDQTMLGEMIEAFKAAYPDQTFDIRLGVESEATAKDTILTDPQSAADVFAFASDQLPDLVNAGAILELSQIEPALQSIAGKSLSDIQSANTADSVNLATYDGKMYAFPMAADGWFMFYDANVIKPEDCTDWITLLDAANAAGKKVGFTWNSGWYNACWFYGAGFSTGLNADGTTSCDFNGTSSKGVSGVDVVKYMQTVASHPGMMNITETSSTITGGDCVAIMTGCWDAETVGKTWGDNYGACKLPSFTINGQTFESGAVKSCKLIGVNPFSQQTGWAVILAEYLTNEANQVTRFTLRAAPPTNVAAASDPAVSANKGVGALAEQAPTALVQAVGNKFWDPMGTFGESIAQGTLATDDAGIQAALDTLVEGITAPAN